MTPGAVLVHVGPSKTGTTALQVSVHQGQTELLRQGVLYPGSPWSHSLAGESLLGFQHPHQPVPPDRSAWDSLVDDVLAREDKAIISSEALSNATDPQVAQLVNDVGPNSVYSLITLRPLERMLVGDWQQAVRYRPMPDLDVWLKARLFDEGHKYWRSRWSPLVARWADQIGPDRVCVMAVGGSEPARMYRDFEALVGIDRGTLRSSRANRSLSATEVRLVRETQRRWPKSRDVVEYRKLLRPVIARTVDARETMPGEAPVSLPAWAVERSRDLSSRMLAEIEELGVHEVGDFPSLIPRTAVQEAEPPEAGEALAIDAAATMMVSLLERTETLLEHRDAKLARAAAQEVKMRRKIKKLRRRSRAAERRRGASGRGSDG